MKLGKMLESMKRMLEGKIAREKMHCNLKQPVAKGVCHFCFHIPPIIPVSRPYLRFGKDLDFPLPHLGPIPPLALQNLAIALIKTHSRITHVCALHPSQERLAQLIPSNLLNILIHLQSILSTKRDVVIFLLSQPTTSHKATEEKSLLVSRLIRSATMIAARKHHE
jgi:hypothetical protein